MARFRFAAALLAVGVSVPQPSAAQIAPVAQVERKPSAFAGFNLRMPLGAPAKASPSVRMQITLDPGFQGTTSGFLHNARPQGLEIGLMQTGKPALFLNGQSVMDAQTRLGFGGSAGRTTLIVGGVILAVVVIAVLAGGSGPGDTCPTVGGSRDHCINP